MPSHRNTPSPESFRRSAATFSAPVRRDGVTARPAPADRLSSSSRSASRPVRAGVSRKRLPAPPSSTATRGRGNPAIRGARRRAPSASLCGVIRLGAPRDTMTLGPDSPSCRGATTRSKSFRRALGSWTWTAKQPPPAARRIAAPKGALRRPQVITRRGQGGASGSPLPAARSRGRGQRRVGRRVHGAPTVTRLTTVGRPTASASPSAWFSMPAAPPVTTQHTGAGGSSVVWNVEPGMGGFTGARR